MKYSLTILFSLLLAPIFAETINNITYDLPQTAQEWVVDKSQNEQGTTITYTPKGTTKQNAKEYFTANSTKIPINVNDQSALRADLTKMYPQFGIELRILSHTFDGVIYEWWGKENAQEKVHGWGRVFSNRDGTVVLTYATEAGPNVGMARSIWLPVLKNAR